MTLFQWLALAHDVIHPFEPFLKQLAFTALDARFAVQHLLWRR